MVGVAAEALRLGLDVTVEGLGVGQGLVRGEDRLGVAGGEGAALVGGARLDVDRPALRRPWRTERPADLEEAADVVDRVHLVHVDVGPARAVDDEGVVLPAVPELGDDVDELLGAGVALLGLRHGVQAEVVGRGLAPGGDDVPAGAATRHLVEAREEPGQVVRLVEGRAGGGDQADPLGGRGDRREERDRLEPVGGAVGRSPPGRTVGQEDRVELGGLGLAGDVLVPADVAEALCAAVGVAPRGLVVAGVVQERVEAELSAHASPLSGRSLSRVEHSTFGRVPP